jgi:HdeA/HdeB family
MQDRIGGLLPAGLAAPAAHARGGRRRSWNQGRYLLIFSRCTAGAWRLQVEASLLLAGAPQRSSTQSWLSGYYNGKRNNTVLDTQEFRERARKVMEYCQVNPKATVMEAVEKVVGVSE